MEKRVSDLETDYSAFISEVSGTLVGHTGMLRVLTRDTTELKARATVIEVRLGNIDERIASLEENVAGVHQKLDQILALLARNT